jgi:hypothetical protein
MMINGVTTVERAFELARTGQCRSITEVRNRLHKETFVDATAQLSSRALTRELRRLFATRRWPACQEP